MRAVDIREDIARAQRIHVDVEASPLECHRPGHVHHRSLAHRVDTDLGQHLECCHRGDIDNPRGWQPVHRGCRARTCDHALRHRLRHEEGSPGIGGEDGVKVLRCDLDQPIGTTDAGVVDQYIDLPGQCNRLVDCRWNRIDLRNIERDRKGLVATGMQLRTHFLEKVHPARRQHHPCPLRCKYLGKTPAQSAGRPGNEGDLALQAEPLAVAWDVGSGSQIGGGYFGRFWGYLIRLCVAEGRRCLHGRGNQKGFERDRAPGRGDQKGFARDRAPGRGDRKGFKRNWETVEFAREWLLGGQSILGSDRGMVMTVERETMAYDVLVVGGGPAGLAAAIRLKQRGQETGQEIQVCVLEKGSEVGAHILSGAVMDPRAMEELFPDWKSMGAPLETEVQEDSFLFLSEGASTAIPPWALPACFTNHGNYIVSLSNVVKWMGRQAEALGVDVYPGFAASDLLFTAEGAVRGVLTGDLGISRQGAQRADFQPGMELTAKYTLLAEGSRGHLGKRLIERFDLARGRDPQSYAIGLKELWEVRPERHREGLVLHTAGWPLDNHTYGGSFLYHMKDRLVSTGFVVGLGYTNPWLSPFEEFQRYKTHPAICRYLEGGKRIGYGARAITAGGINSLPRFVFPGGALIGCDAGFLNASRIKGSHAAIKTGMLAAEAAAQALAEGRAHDSLDRYTALFEASWLHEELHAARNFKAAMSKGLWMGTLLVGIDQMVFKGKAPYTMHLQHADHEGLASAPSSTPIHYPKPDGKVSFDRLSSVFLSNTNHEEDQPIHLRLKDEGIPVNLNLARYAGPEQRYCPAGVYEYVPADGGSGDAMRLQINAQNCVHCKTCDIKDPAQNIVWVAPEGGGGPNYVGM